MSRIVLFLCLLFLVQITAARESLKIYVDADFKNSPESAESIFMGMQTALDETENRVQGINIELVKKDHRGNVKRSLRHMQEFIEDPDALLILGGLHSPPYILHRDFINENEVLLLVAWAAGGPITRYPSKDNWVFRLSIDDTKAAHRIAHFVQDEKGCQRPHMLLEDTSWGQSNFDVLSKFAREHANAHWPVTWFGWNISYAEARIKSREIQAADADCIIFVGNHFEGEKFAKASASLPEPRPSIVSHWGIAGSDFQERVKPDIRAKLDLNFIQTCYSFLSDEQPAYARQVFARARKLFPNVLKTPADIPAPPGFIHAFDLGRVMLKALEDVPVRQPIKPLRLALRDSLETLPKPVVGLVKTYQQPFRQWSEQDTDAHEALGLNDICMARFNKQNKIVLH